MSLNLKQQQKAQVTRKCDICWNFNKQNPTPKTRQNNDAALPHHRTITAYTGLQQLKREE